MSEAPIDDSRLLTSDGVELATRSWSLNGEPRAVVVLVHGLSSTKDHPHVVALAECLRARSLEVLSYDARGHGESGGLCTLGVLERNDVAAAVAHARISHPRVALVGASMGAVAAIAYGATDPELAGVVVVSSPADWRIPFRIRALMTFVLARTKLGRFLAERHTHVRIYPEWNPSEPPRSMAKKVVSAVPLAIVHGRNDRLIPFDFSLGVSTIDIPDAHAVVVPGMGHAFDPVGHESICDALDWTLDKAASREVVLSTVETDGS
jgi:alpha-beta hydrolase superfamily lysophospholipase